MPCAEWACHMLLCKKYLGQLTSDCLCINMLSLMAVVRRQGSRRGAAAGSGGHHCQEPPRGAGRSLPVRPGCIQHSSYREGRQ